jgi:hypothetical protein
MKLVPSTLKVTKPYPVSLFKAVNNPSQSSPSLSTEDKIICETPFILAALKYIVPGFV